MDRVFNPSAPFTVANITMESNRVILFHRESLFFSELFLAPTYH